jgi:hypothetical protein
LWRRRSTRSPRSPATTQLRGGRRPHDPPAPRKPGFKPAINLGTAKALGLTCPAKPSRHADEAIE